ncbi:MAG: hypothetical protein K0R39_4764 [Symbiobacteriaceae bacterium]|nr:hypothetical protein [Symbiobacteriaceae bacterium]
MVEEYLTPLRQALEQMGHARAAADRINRQMEDPSTKESLLAILGALDVMEVALQEVGRMESKLEMALHKQVRKRVEQWHWKEIDVRTSK